MKKHFTNLLLCLTIILFLPLGSLANDEETGRPPDAFHTFNTPTSPTTITTSPITNIAIPSPTPSVCIIDPTILCSVACPLLYAASCSYVGGVPTCTCNFSGSPFSVSTCRLGVEGCKSDVCISPKRASCTRNVPPANPTCSCI